MIIDLGDTCWLCSPDTPSTPFGSPLLDVFDTLRVICYLTTVVIVVYAVVMATRTPYPTQRARLAALAGFSLITLGTEIEHLGDGASWRLFSTIVVTVLAVYGMWGMTRELDIRAAKETPDGAPDRPPN